MATSAQSNHSSFRDPYQLDRLADELASRELHSPRNHVDPETLIHHNLLEYHPLSHNDKYLTAEVFNVEEFLSSRSHISLQDLRAELREYLSELKEELVKLINDDYEAFISLSTDLRDEGSRMERIKHPLAEIKVKVLESEQELQVIQATIHEKLTKRNILREEKALLHLLLKISESVSRLESLLHITSPDEGATDALEIDNSKYVTYPNRSEDHQVDSFRGNRSKHLGRVAAEYTQLLYYAHKAREERCVFVNEVQWRIDRVQSTLSSDLDQLFAHLLVSLTDPKGENRGTELERAKWIADLTECMRAYDMLGLWEDAEDVLRRDVMRVFVKKTIFPGALAAPHSPIMPNTPYHLSGPGPMTSTNLPHQIPFTPFTAFISKQCIPKISEIPSDLPQAHLLEDLDNPLANLYNQILRFVERDITRIMVIADKLTVKHRSESRLEKPPPVLSTIVTEVDGGKRGFQIMANVVWNELGRSIMDEIGGVVFAAGRPHEFRKHYETTQAFVRSLELLAPSLKAVEAMRRHPTYVAFERRWQLPVYFQLRWKEVIATLEEALSVVKSEPNPSKDKGSFTTLQAAATWVALSSCWSSEIYIPELCHRFWRLTLQILVRYKLWLDEYLTALDLPGKVITHASQETTMSPNASRTTTSTTANDLPSAETVATDDALLQQYASAIVDIRILDTNVRNLWHQIISVVMTEPTEMEGIRLEDGLLESLQNLGSFVDPLSRKIIGILTKRCCDALLPVRSIPSQFRAMSNKRNPTEFSYFIPMVLRPLKLFFAVGVADGPGHLLKDEYLKTYATEVFDHVTMRFISYLTAMKKTEESLKRLKKGKKTTFTLLGNSSTEEGRDEARIRTQMILDVEAFGKDAESLQVAVETNQNYLTLKEMVCSSDTD